MLDQAILPAGFTTRPATPADAQPVTDLLNAEIFSILGEEHFSLEECLQEWGEPGFDLAASSCCVLAADGRLAGYVEVWDNQDLPTRIQPFGSTHPEFYGQGVGSYLLAWGEWRCRQALARVPDDVQVRMLVSTPNHQPAVALFVDQGFHHSRSFLRMEIDLDREIPTAVWPAGFTVKTLAEIDDLQPFFLAYDEAFRDHWGYVAEGDKGEKFERFQHQTKDPAFDRSLWFAVYEEDEVAAVGLCSPKSNENPLVGEVSNFGVRPAWRKRGLALNLLFHIFGEFKRRGRFEQVALGVDAQSLTGATRLYLRAGMRMGREDQVWEKVIREGRVLEAE